ncbi:MAG: zinc-ribbon domain-containing protein [Syntrophaceae bacterium]
MIIQCKSCGTKFRFDENLIEGEGAWVRCSHCKNVFFLENPAKMEIVFQTNHEKEMESPQITRISEKPGQIFEDRRDVQKGPEILTVRDMEKDVGNLGKRNVTGSEKSEERRLRNKDKVTEEKVEKKRVMGWGKQILYLLVILILGGVYITFFTETGGQVLSERILGLGQKAEDVGPAQVDIVDVRQRIVNNVSLGDIRIVEGTAINQSSYPMTRIKIKGEITDNYTVVLGVRESYCGNLLTDNELATMTDDQIVKELSNPQGSDISNDRIESKGQIPFMVVFTREPAGVAKAFVIPVGAERLLP